jgi:hypothetical protein
VDVEGDLSRRLVAAGAALVGGLFLGAWFTLRFEWYPTSWQWLAYHNGLVALASIYVLLPEGSDEMPEAPWDDDPAKSPIRVPRGPWVIEWGPEERRDSGRIVIRENGRRGRKNGSSAPAA